MCVDSGTYKVSYLKRSNTTVIYMNKILHIFVCLFFAGPTTLFWVAQRALRGLGLLLYIK